MIAPNLPESRLVSEAIGRAAGSLVAAVAAADPAVGNLTLEDMLLLGDMWPLPTSLAHRRNAPTCYIACPSVAYLDYAVEELRHLRQSPALAAGMRMLIGMARPLVVASGLDHQVQPNQWLMATNIWPGLSREAIGALTDQLTSRYPDRAIVWRSLNATSDPQALADFAAHGYELLPARQVYLFDARTSQPSRHRDEIRDSRLLAGSGLARVEPEALMPDDFEAIARLYGQLYLDKYTPLNPQYTPAFLCALHEAGLVRFLGLRAISGALVGVVGLFEQGDVMTAPIVGYDTSRPQREGLYRQLMAMALDRARRERKLFNMSAGAASFKRNRGALSAIEYTAVHVRHLGLRQRMATGAMRWILDHVGIPIMQRFEL